MFTTKLFMLVFTLFGGCTIRDPLYAAKDDCQDRLPPIPTQLDGNAEQPGKAIRESYQHAHVIAAIDIRSITHSEAICPQSSVSHQPQSVRITDAGGEVIAHSRRRLIR